MKIATTNLTVGELLKDGKTYAVPIFQRSYSWEKQQIIDFWDDLINLYEYEEDGYFIGSMVFTPDLDGGQNRIRILDGQQRLATLLLFLSTLRDILRQSTLKRAPDWAESINNILCFTDPVTCSKNPKLILNRDDKVFFEKIIIEGIVPSTKYNSHKLIKEACTFLRTEINKKIKNDKENFVGGILNIIMNKLLMIKIEADSEVNAHMIFETLNDRGLDLSVADLAKNYIFSISGPHLEDIIQIWKDVVDQVGDHNVTKFLRHYWNSRFELVKKEELYKRLKVKVTEGNVRNFMEKLSEESTVYANLNNPTHEFWGDPETEYMLDELNIFKVEQIYSLLLALYEKFYSEKDFFKKMLLRLVNFTFRYNTICGLDPKELERLYSNLSIKIRENKIAKNKIIEEIRRPSPSKAKFIASFKEIETKNAKLAKYILLKINNHLFRKRGKKEIEINTNVVNLEHIIPKKPNKDWKEFFRKENITEEELIYRLGNMTILLKEYNRKIANDFFDKKKEMYKKSDLPLNKELIKHDRFGEKEIEKRQERIARLAEELWKI